MASGASRTVTGGLVGTGSALSVEVGYRPRLVRLFNSSGLVLGEWHDPMPEGSMRVQATNGDVGFDTSTGITPTPLGFDLGANPNINVNGQTIYWSTED